MVPPSEAARSTQSAARAQGALCSRGTRSRRFSAGFARVASARRSGALSLAALLLATGCSHDLGRRAPIDGASDLRRVDSGAGEMRLVDVARPDLPVHDGPSRDALAADVGIAIDGSPDAATDAGVGTEPVQDAARDAADDATGRVYRVFVTSELFRGDLREPSTDGLRGADHKCQRLADSARLGGSYKAWLSTVEVSAGARLTHRGPYVRVDGTRVADDWADLTDGALDAPIGVDETGTSVSAFAACSSQLVAPVITATDIGGDYIATAPGANADCDAWTRGTGSSESAVGNALRASAHWTQACIGPIICGSAGSGGHLYCFEQ